MSDLLRRQFVFGPSTKFAPAERASEPELRAAIRVATTSPVVTAILNSFDGLVLVLNPERQVVAANFALLERFGVECPEDCFGFRAGELLNCIHAFEQNGGCGTSEICAACGAAAMVACQATGQSAEGECLLTVRRGATTEALDLNVRATPMTIDGRQFIVVCLRDISDGKRRQVLEQVFFHDIINTVVALRECGRFLKAVDAPLGDAAKFIDRTASLTERLTREVLDQRALLEAENGTLRLDRSLVTPAEAIEMVRKVFSDHPVASGKKLEVLKVAMAASVTDSSLLGRVLANMVKNAFEATPTGGTVRIWCEAAAGSCGFFVWNEGAIPQNVARRIFERSFSTKGRSGRGLGTYAMKLFGERYLGGKVSFTSTAEDGTVFSIWLPEDSLPTPRTL